MNLMYEDASRQPDQEPACLIDDPGAIHDGHHVHQGPNYEACSCGESIGAWSVAFDDEAAGAAFWSQARCRVCGAEGVIWADLARSDP